jgi:hypothetical protein
MLGKHLVLAYNSAKLPLSEESHLRYSIYYLTTTTYLNPMELYGIP